MVGEYLYVTAYDYVHTIPITYDSISGLYVCQLLVGFNQAFCWDIVIY